MRRSVRLVTWFLVGAVLAAVSGCAYVQPDKEIETDPQPVMKGPGIFTGRSGEWVIMQRR